jgi:nucleotide-binding universal stress UspA family protein
MPAERSPRAALRPRPRRPRRWAATPPRQSRGPSKPERIVAGVDGSPGSRAALAAARPLAARLGCPLLPLVTLTPDAQPALPEEECADAALVPGDLVPAIAEAASSSSLVLVGAGGSGRRGAGLAERVVYATRCSTLVVRPAADA